jgi:hypothetical protein
MKNIVLVAILLSLLSKLQAQHLRLAYFGENATHYGIRGGVEYDLKTWEKGRKGGLMTQNALLFGLTLTAFRHPDNHIGLILAPELGWRRTGRRGGVVQAALSPGLIRTFYEAKTWQPDENGSFKKVPFAGQWGFLPGVSLGFGHDFSVRHNRPLLLFANLHYMRQYPYNQSFLHRTAIEVGIIKKQKS